MLIGLLMKIVLILVSTLLASVSRILAVPLPAVPDAPLTSSARSFESGLLQLDNRIEAATEKHNSYTRTEKWAAVAVGGLSVLTNGGWLASGALTLAIHHRHAAKLLELKRAVAQADYAAKLRGEGPHTDVRTELAKRDEENVETAAADLVQKVGDDETSFRTALSRTHSERLADLDEEDKQTWEELPYHPWTSSSSSSSSRPHDSFKTHERLAAIEAAILRQRQHQYDQLNKLSPFAKVMVGVGVGNAGIAVASAELSAHDAAETKKKDQKGKDVPDVTNLAQETCKKFEGDVDGLDCSKAKGPALA